MRQAVLIAVVVGLVSWGRAARADDAVPEDRIDNGVKVRVLPPVKVVGRRLPILAVDVARVTHTVALSDLRQRFLNRIEKPVASEPF